MSDSRTITYQSPQLATSNGISLCYDAFGSSTDEPIVLIMGLGGQMIQWDDAFCIELASNGFRVIRFDNRDIGHSTKFSGGKSLTTWELVKLRLFNAPVDAPYTLTDMAKDVADLLDALGIKAAHIVGISMGGMIAQTLALDHPQRLLSLTSIMSTTGNPRLPQPGRDITTFLLTPSPTDKKEFIAHFAQTWRMLRAGSFPLDEERDRERGERVFARGLNPAGTMRQLRAILASGSRHKALNNVRIPTLVIHGSADPLVHPEGGRDTAESIPGSQYLVIDGMGHALPIPMWPQVIGAIVDHARRASARAHAN
jgi:pimeloyl-ACP methyl ester carboxylesterase